MSNDETIYRNQPANFDFPIREPDSYRTYGSLQFVIVTDGETLGKVFVWINSIGLQYNAPPPGGRRPIDISDTPAKTYSWVELREKVRITYGEPFYANLDYQGEATQNVSAFPDARNPGTYFDTGNHQVIGHIDPPYYYSDPDDDLMIKAITPTSLGYRRALELGVQSFNSQFTESEKNVILSGGTIPGVRIEINTALTQIPETGGQAGRIGPTPYKPGDVLYPIGPQGGRLREHWIGKSIAPVPKDSNAWTVTRQIQDFSRPNKDYSAYREKLPERMSVFKRYGSVILLVEFLFVGLALLWKWNQDSDPDIEEYRKLVRAERRAKQKAATSKHGVVKAKAKIDKAKVDQQLFEGEKIRAEEDIQTAEQLGKIVKKRKEKVMKRIGKEKIKSSKKLLEDLEEKQRIRSAIREELPESAQPLVVEEISIGPEAGKVARQAVVTGGEVISGAVTTTGEVAKTGLAEVGVTARKGLEVGKEVVVTPAREVGKIAREGVREIGLTERERRRQAGISRREKIRQKGLVKRTEIAERGAEEVARIVRGPEEEPIEEIPREEPREIPREEEREEERIPVEELIREAPVERIPRREIRRREPLPELPEIVEEERLPLPGGREIPPGEFAESEIIEEFAEERERPWASAEERERVLIEQEKPGSLIEKIERGVRVSESGRAKENIQNITKDIDKLIAKNAPLERIDEKRRILETKKANLRNIERLNRDLKGIIGPEQRYKLARIFNSQNISEEEAETLIGNIRDQEDLIERKIMVREFISGFAERPMTGIPGPRLPRPRRRIPRRLPRRLPRRIVPEEEEFQPLRGEEPIEELIPEEEGELILERPRRIPRRLPRRLPRRIPRRIPRRREERIEIEEAITPEELELEEFGGRRLKPKTEEEFVLEEAERLRRLEEIAQQERIRISPEGLPIDIDTNKPMRFEIGDFGTKRFSPGKFSTTREEPGVMVLEETFQQINKPKEAELRQPLRFSGGYGNFIMKTGKDSLGSRLVWNDGIESYVFDNNEFFLMAADAYKRRNFDRIRKLADLDSRILPDLSNYASIIRRSGRSTIGDQESKRFYKNLISYIRNINARNLRTYVAPNIGRNLPRDKRKIARFIKKHNILDKERRIQPISPDEWGSERFKAIWEESSATPRAEVEMEEIESAFD